MRSHKQLLKDILVHAYNDEYVTLETIEGIEKDKEYIFRLLVCQGYLENNWKEPNKYNITDKGRIFYLTSY